MSVGEQIQKSDMESNIFYVVAYRHDRTWYTLLENNKCYWVFERYPKMYKRLGFAQKALNRVERRYSNDEAYVFKCCGFDLIGAESYNKWKNDRRRAVVRIVKES